MRIERLSAFVSIACMVLLASCAGSGRTTIPASGQGVKTAQVRFTIALPTAAVAAKQRRLQYVSGNTLSATVSVTTAGSPTVYTTTIGCDTVARSCSGTVTAPIGTDTFAVTLWSGSNGTGNALSTGTATAQIGAGVNPPVNVTFNPIVGSVKLTFGGANPIPPFLDRVNRPSALLDLVATDPSGWTIVGPGNFVDANGTPLTFTLLSNDPNTTLSASGQAGAPSFTAPGSVSSPDQVMLALKGAPSTWEDPVVSIASSGGVAPAITNIDVPVSPVQSQPNAFMGNDMTSMAVDPSGNVYATAIDFNVSSSYSLIVNSTPNEPPVDPATTKLSFTVMAGATPWFFVDNATTPTNKIAELSPPSGCPGTPPVCPGSSLPSEVNALVLGQDGQLWFAESAARRGLGERGQSARHAPDLPPAGACERDGQNASARRDARIGVRRRDRGLCVGAEQLDRLDRPGRLQRDGERGAEPDHDDQRRRQYSRILAERLQSLHRGSGRRQRMAHRPRERYRDGGRQ